MPDQKLTELPPPAGGAAAADLLYLVDVDDAADSPEGSSRRTTAGSLPRPEGRTLTVDSVHGDDATARRGDAAFPFLTPAAAKAAALAGDVIHVRPGDHTDPAAPLLADGVGWRFEPGAAVRLSSDGPGLFDDGGAAVEAAVVGAGEFAVEATTAGPAPAAVSVAHPASRVTLTARRLACSNAVANAAAYAVSCSDGTLSVTADEITNAGTPTASVWWSNGRLHVAAKRIAGAGSWTVCAAGSDPPTGDLYVQADEIAGDAPLGLQTAHPAAAVWVRALTVRGTGVLPQAILVSGSARFYVEAQKVFGPARFTAATGGASLTYLRAVKWSAVANGAANNPQILNVLAGTHTVLIELLEADPAGFAGEMFTVAAGTVLIRGMKYVAAAGSQGLKLTGGTLRLVDCLIDTTANAATNPVTKSGGTLVLENCTLLAEGTRDAIAAPAAQAVTVRGTLTVNRPLSANVTAAGGPTVRTDTGTLAAAGALTAAGLVTAAAGITSPRGAATGTERYGSNAAPNVTGNYNTAVGADCGTGLSTGTGNVVVGFQAATVLTTGGNNVVIGFQGGGNLATGSWNVAIGAQLNLPAATSNSVAVGSDQNLAGSNSTITLGSGMAVAHANVVAFGTFAVSTKNNQLLTGTEIGAWTLTAQSSVQPRPVAEHQREWADSTDATRKGRLKAGAYAGATWQEGWRVEAGAAEVLAGFFGAAAVPRQAVGAAATDPATTQALANALRTALIALGFCKP